MIMNPAMNKVKQVGNKQEQTRPKPNAAAHLHRILHLGIFPTPTSWAIQHIMKAPNNLSLIIPVFFLLSDSTTDWRIFYGRKYDHTLKSNAGRCVYFLSNNNNFIKTKIYDLHWWFIYFFRKTIFTQLKNFIIEWWLTSAL